MAKDHQDNTSTRAFVEFQIIIVTSDENNFVSSFCENRCKGLIKICNRPVIYYAIKNVIEQKLRYITILVNEHFYDEMNEYIQVTFPENYKNVDKKSKNNYYIDVVACPSSPDGEELGTVECLLEIKNKIKTDFIVINCDIFGFVDLHSLANLFRGENAMCAMLLLEDDSVCLNESKKRKKNTKEHDYLNYENNVWVCIDRNSKIVSIKDALSMKQNGKMKISKYNLYYHKNCLLKTDLLDSHVYIFKHYVLDILEKKKDKLTSIKYDVIPYLTKIQNTPKAVEYAHSGFQFNMYNTLINQYDAIDTSQTDSKMCPVANILEKQDHTENVVCYIQPKKAGFCQRINTIMNLFRANLIFCVQRHDQLKPILPNYCFFLLTEKNQSYKDSVISGHFTHDENVVLKKCIIGKCVDIKKKTSIFRSVLMDNIKIEDNCKIENCIICNNVVIESGCTLTDCIIKENAVIEKGSFFERETLPLFLTS